jgi:hypothetical protein
MKETPGAQYARKRGAAPWMHPERPGPARRSRRAFKEDWLKLDSGVLFMCEIRFSYAQDDLTRGGRRGAPEEARSLRPGLFSSAFPKELLL